VLYQVWALVRTLDEAMVPGTDIALDMVHRQADELILSVVEALEGDVEREMARVLLRVRHALANRGEDEDKWQAEVEGARARAINTVTNFFYERLTALPTIKAYIDHFGHA